MNSLSKSLTRLAACAGTWRGTNRLHDPHTNAPDDSASALTVSPVLGGRFVRIDYTWTYRGAPQEGSLLLGAEPEGHEIAAHWIDTWHMDHKVMVCRGAVEGENRIVVVGSYTAPPGPDWGWRIELTLDAGRSVGIRMFNVTPDGQAAPAVEASYTPAQNVASPVEANERGLAGIGQIAVTVSDVGKALPFYRDVLGLKFLFSPGPNLAFLMAGSTRLMLTTPQGAGQAGANSILYFKVMNIEATFGAIVQRGAQSERPPQLTARMPDHELWIGFVRDPDGNLVGLMEEKR